MTAEEAIRKLRDEQELLKQMSEQINIYSPKAAEMAEALGMGIAALESEEQKKTYYDYYYLEISNN